jgi:hypothetical protein
MCLYERVVQYWVDLIWPARVLGSLRTKPRQPRASKPALHTVGLGLRRLSWRGVLYNCQRNCCCYRLERLELTLNR